MEPKPEGCSITTVAGAGHRANSGAHEANSASICWWCSSTAYSTVNPASLDGYQVVAALPVPQVGSQDPSCALLANLQHTQPRQALDLLQRIPDRAWTAPTGAPGSFEF